MAPPAAPGAALYWQGCLLDLDEQPALDPALRGLRRHVLDPRSWVDVLPSWVHGGDTLLETVLASAAWEGQRTRQMYDRTVAEPRILARWPDLSTLPPAVAAMRHALSRHYATDFDLVAVNLYRDGRDSVAWHGDRVRLTHTNPLVATVSLGARRRFLVRPRGGGRTVLALHLGAGDLCVMGGACQHEWEHTVPKVAESGVRMALTFRHSGVAGRAGPAAGAAGSSAGGSAAASVAAATSG